MHCQYTPTTIAIAALKWAFEAGQISWHRIIHRGEPNEEKIPVWEDYRRGTPLTAQAVPEEVPAENVTGTLSPAVACTHLIISGMCKMCWPAVITCVWCSSHGMCPKLGDG